MYVRLCPHCCNKAHPLAFLCYCLKIPFIDAGQSDFSFLLKTGRFLLKLSLYRQFLPNIRKCKN